MGMVEARVYMPFLDTASSWHINMFTVPEASQISWFNNFYWRFITSAQLINSSVTGDCTLSQFPPPQRSESGLESSNPHLVLLGLSGKKPSTLELSRSSALTRLININLGVVEWHSLWITKDTSITQKIAGSFRSFVPGAGNKDQIYMFHYKTGTQVCSHGINYKEFVLSEAISNQLYHTHSCTSQVVLVVKNLPANVEDLSSVSGSGRSSGGGCDNPLLYTCLENPMERGAWQVTVLGVSKSWTWLKWLSKQHSHIQCYQLCPLYFPPFRACPSLM